MPFTICKADTHTHTCTHSRTHQAWLLWGENVRSLQSKPSHPTTSCQWADGALFYQICVPKCHLIKDMIGHLLTTIGWAIIEKGKILIMDTFVAFLDYCSSEFNFSLQDLDHYIHLWFFQIPAELMRKQFMCAITKTIFIVSLRTSQMILLWCELLNVFSGTLKNQI